MSQGVYPGDPVGHSLILDAVASLAVVFHHLSGATSALLVYLVEDCVVGAGDANGILLDEPHNGVRVKEVAQEVEEVGERIGPHRFQDYIHRYGADSSRWLRLRLRLGRRVFHVSAGGFVVTASVLLADNLVVGIDIRREAVLTATGWTGQA